MWRWICNRNPNDLLNFNVHKIWILAYHLSRCVRKSFKRIKFDEWDRVSAFDDTADGKTRMIRTMLAFHFIFSGIYVVMLCHDFVAVDSAGNEEIDRTLPIWNRTMYVCKSVIHFWCFCIFFYFVISTDLTTITSTEVIYAFTTCELFSRIGITYSEKSQ